MSHYLLKKYEGAADIGSSSVTKVRGPIEADSPQEAVEESGLTPGHIIQGGRSSLKVYHLKEDENGQPLITEL